MAGCANARFRRAQHGFACPVWRSSALIGATACIGLIDIGISLFFGLLSGLIRIISRTE
jgi:hypothetical protein